MKSYSEAELTSLDIDWFGVDKSGRLAQFASSSTGLVPRAVVEKKAENERLGEYFLESLERNSCTVTTGWKQLISLPDDRSEARYLDSFVEWGELGFYSYDCVYRGSVEPGGPYFLVARPGIPRTIKSLPSWARSFVESVVFPFEFENAVEIRTDLLDL